MGECAMLGRGSTDLVRTLYRPYSYVRTRPIPKVFITRSFEVGANLGRDQTNCAKIGCDQSLSGRRYA